MSFPCSRPASTTPASFVNPGSPGQFVSIENELLWPVNALSATTGSKSFRMQCEPGGQSITRTVTFNESFVEINDFNITQTSAEQGGTINFNWNVSLINNPPDASCELRSLTSGVINPVTINAQTTPVGSSQPPSCRMHHSTIACSASSARRATTALMILSTSPHPAS